MNASQPEPPLPPAPPVEPRPKRFSAATFDALWPRIAQAVGGTMGLVEFVWARSEGRMVDAAVLSFAGGLALLPTVLKNRKGGES